jgi:hypothetical protein
MSACKKKPAPPLTATQPAGVTGPVDELFKQTLPDAKGAPRRWPNIKARPCW